MKLIERIQTERLAIRPFEKKDLDGFVKFMLDKRVTRYLLFSEEQKTEQGAKELFDYVIKSYTSGAPVHSYAIVDLENSFIGSCGFSPISDNGVYECFYSLSPEYWGHGYATEATRALIGDCFRSGEAREMQAYVDPENPASARVAEKSGMKYRGVHKHPHMDVKFEMYAITEKEFTEAATG